MRIRHRRPSDDEIAVAACLYGMRAFVETGRSFYSSAEAAEDHYLALTMDEAARAGRPMRTTRQVWAGLRRLQ
jgi:hypothetical protein